MATSVTPLSSDPFRQFQQWFTQARKDPQIDLPDAMCLSTVTRQGTPAARMVLLKGVDRRGFSFFTHVRSPKARDLQARPHASLTFHWRSQRRQIRVDGKASLLPKRVADAYFATRPRDSQIGSWASRQSEVLESREALLALFEKFKKQFEGKKVPAPPHWQGFCVAPSRIEFWQEGPYRLHDRWLYTKTSAGRWLLQRLYP
jgi:pyridoxamine 5'-phosphate oxidase